MDIVVTGHGDESTESNSERVENLCGGFQPDLRISKFIKLEKENKENTKNKIEILIIPVICWHTKHIITCNLL